LKTVGDIRGASPIILSAASTNSGYHILWSSEDKGTNYQSFDPETMAATQSVSLSDQAGSSLAIASDGDVVHILWADGRLYYHRSENGGRTWHDDSRAFASLESGVEHVSALATNGVVHVLFGNRSNLYYRRGEQEGTEWSSPKALASSQSQMLSKASLALAPGNGLHVVWADYVESSGSMEGVLLYRTSSDGGVTWRDTENLFTAEGAPITQPTVAATGESVIIAWLSDGTLHYLTLQGGQRTFLETIEHAWPAGGAQRTLDLVSCGQDTACLAWIDRRHVHKEWWASLPLHEIVTWDQDPYWANNDLYLQALGGETRSLRLTPDLSYAFSVHAMTNDNGAIVLWSGRARVGRLLGDSKDPYTIFWLRAGIGAR
jgi:hypothetical protein